MHPIGPAGHPKNKNPWDQDLKSAGPTPKTPAFGPSRFGAESPVVSYTLSSGSAPKTTAGQAPEKAFFILLENGAAPKKRKRAEPMGLDCVFCDWAYTDKGDAFKIDSRGILGSQLGQGGAVWGLGQGMAAGGALWGGGLGEGF